MTRYQFISHLGSLIVPCHFNDIIVVIEMHSAKRYNCKQCSLNILV